MSLSPEEKVRILDHLGYPQMKEARTFFLGFPISAPVTTMADGSVDHIRPEAEDQVRLLLDRLDGIEAQMLEDQELAAVGKIDEIEVNQNEFDQLLGQYKYWQAKLGNLLGIPPNPFDQRYLGGLGGVNVPVM